MDGFAWGNTPASTQDPRADLFFLAFKERHFEHLVVHDRAVAEIAVFAEALAVVGGDDEMRADRRFRYQRIEHAVDVFDGLDLLQMQILHLFVDRKSTRLNSSH